MHRHTQSNLDPGNCWQTAVACILEVDPDTLPPQVELEAMEREHRLFDGWGSYGNILQGYLWRHHGLRCTRLEEWQARGLHIENLGVLCGPTVRTAALEAAGKPHVHHAIVGWYTRSTRDWHQYWDPHPSRAGLLEVDSVEYLIERDEKDIAHTDKMCAKHRAEGNEASTMVFLGCLCPQHELGWARDVALAKEMTTA